MIPEGLTMRKTGIILEEGGICPESDFCNSCFDKTLLKKYEIPSENAEGLLFPDTYYFTPDMNSSDVVSIMIENFMAKAEGFAILSLLLTSKILHNYNEKNNNSNPNHSITDFPGIS